MFFERWVALWLPFFFISLVAASNISMTAEQIEKYIQLKLNRNDRILRLNEKLIGDDGAKILAKSPLLSSVETLIIYKGNIGDDGIRALASSKQLAQLTAMHLENNHITDHGAKIIASSDTFKKPADLKSLS